MSDNAPERIDILEVCFYPNNTIKVGGSKYILKETTDKEHEEILKLIREAFQKILIKTIETANPPSQTRSIQEICRKLLRGQGYEQKSNT